MNNDTQPESIAIVGMAGRFPQAATLEEFWANLREGREAVTFFAAEDAQWLPLEHRPRADDPHFVRARAALDRPEWFDAGFFRLNPQEAAIMDPQHRVFLECAWEALENAGCNPDAFAGAIGVFAGSGFNSYLFNNLLTNRNLIADYGLFPVLTMNDKDYLATRVAYKLNLRGPSLNVQTACSTSLVAVSLACQHLLDYHCDVALAGGVSITFPTNRGHQHVEGGIMSRDGHCRAFDAQASGTVTGNGAGVVVLKRLSEALLAGDRICAVIKGHAVNNDGGVKMGFTAPSIDGQAECIATAHAMASFTPAPISYIEAHGTGTPLGDPIETAALTKAFRAAPEMGGSCALGSVKTNIGHLDVAAGIAGLIKTTLALQHGEIPPTLHFETLNPEIDFSDKRFFVNQQLRLWPRGATPRRAGVSSFGIGGTNAHVVLEEAPLRKGVAPSRPHQLLRLSARTSTALAAAADNLAGHLERHSEVNLADVAFTLHEGRKAFEHRCAVVASGITDAVSALRSNRGGRLIEGRTDLSDGRVVFMFPGQGAQAVNMARNLYDTEREFRRHVDEACEILNPKLGLNLRDVLFPRSTAAAPSGEPPGSTDALRADAARLLNETRITQPALFVIEHALARLWMEWGIQPAAMIGHSLGEYVAACLAGVFTLEDALTLVAERARLMQAQPAGAMLAVRLSESRVARWLEDPLALAAVNSPGLSVVSGPFEAIELLEQKLAAEAIPAKRLATSHAFHSAMMEPMLPAFADVFRRFVLHRPKLPWVSNVTGAWITPEMAMSPAYWLTHVRRTVRFADGIGELTRAGYRVLLEVGPGQTLAGLARQQAGMAPGLAVSTSLGRAGEGRSDLASMLQALGELWVAGVDSHRQNGFYAQEQRTIVALPTYPFERQRYWIEPGNDWGTGHLPVSPAIAGEPAPAAIETVGVEAAPASAPEPGETAILTVLKQIFQTLSGLDLSQVGADATFNQLGFDSLFLSQACVAVVRRFGVALTFRQLRDNVGTFQKLVTYIEQNAVFAGAGIVVEKPATAAIEVVSEKCIPMTEAQREIWVASQLGATAAAAYHESAMLQLAGPLQVEALQCALDKLVARHEALRTTFAAAGDVQIIAPRGSAELTLRDFSVAVRPEQGRARESEAAQCLAEALQRPFDLVNGPLLRPVLARVDADRHVLALIVHHIICDGWSLGIVVRELAELYAAEVGGRRPVLSVAPLFSEYAQRQRADRREREFAAAEAYWREQFADAVPELDLPTDRARPASRTYAGDFLSHAFSPELTMALKRFCAESESTVFTALLAVFNVLLHRLTDQADLVVGVPTAGQALENQPDLVGHFANLLPIRSRIGEHQTFSDYLVQVQRTVNDALAHGGYPFARLLQQLKVPRDSSRVPLTPVLFNTVHHRGSVELADIVGTVTVQPKQFVNFDLNFNLALTGDSFALGVYYSTELFETATVARWLKHFETLLRGVLADPKICVTDVPLLTAAEREMMLVTWNDTRLDYPRGVCVHELFEEQARLTPDATAVVAGRERLSYRELNQRADRLAEQLRGAGVKPDGLVGILLERTPHLIIGILAVLKAGGAYVPLDSSHPPHRIEVIVSDTRMPVVITERKLLRLLPPGIARVVLTEDEEFAPVAGAEPATARPTEDNLAYVIYTSGSTGQPKGVAVPHRAVIALTAWARQLYRPEELAGVLFATSATFDVSVFECLVPLCLGGKVIVIENLIQLVNRGTTDEVTLVSGVPSAIAEVVRSRLLPESVRTVNLAGEFCPQSLVEALYALPHIERVYDLYGPTETTVYSTGSLRRRGGRATIGRPLSNEQAYILDSHQQPMPIGVRGELYIGGDKLARGYLHRPAMTACRFLEVPHLPAGRVYRTGDAARFMPDGTIEYLGRLDRQVKVRGNRIELAEIESVLDKHPNVAESVAVVHVMPGGAVQLVAYVVPVAGRAVDAAEMRKHALLWLPAPMVPTSFVVLAQMPRTVNGKLDRRSLPAPDFGAVEAKNARPMTEAERYIGEVWCEVLELEHVGMDDNFFALGGHSIHAMQVIARLQGALGLELSLAEFFATPTIAAIAPLVELAVAKEYPA